MKKKIIISLLLSLICVLTGCSKTDVTPSTLMPTPTPIPTPVITLEPKDIQNEEIYIGNKNTKKFHRLNCYTLPAEKNRVKFTSRDRAVNYGYSPCGNCQP